MWRRGIFIVGACLLVLLAVLVTRASLFQATVPVEAQPLKLAIPPDAIKRFSSAVRLPTVSALEDGQKKTQQFLAFHSFLQDAFPRLHKGLTRETINRFALLYTWVGSDPSLKPILLLSHQDVVPIEPGTETDWEYPPFSGEVAEGYVWGRGAWDDKSTLMASMEAVELLLMHRQKPKRTVMLAFGHDEEVGGRRGAVAVANALQRRNLQFELILDEGGVIRAPGVMPGISVPVAMIAIAEKGYLTLELVATDDGGHSSMPPEITAVGRLARALNRLQGNPFPAKMNQAVGEMFAALGPHMEFKSRLIIANQWLFEPLLLNQITSIRGTNAAVRTTIAPTMLAAGVKENILPQLATATVNFRIIPGETSATVIEAVNSIIADPKIEIREAGAIISEPSRFSNINSFAYQQILKSIRQVRPDVIVAPSLLYGATDSRHYAALSEHIYRFTPITYGVGDGSRIHGTNERMSVEDYEKAVRFYVQLISNMALE